MVSRRREGEEPIGLHEDVRHRTSLIAWVCSSHVAIRDSRNNVLPKSFTDIPRQILVWLLREALKPLLYESFKQRWFGWRRLSPQVLRVELADSLDGLW